MTLYADDPDANRVFPITDSQGGDLTWSAVVKAGTTEIAAAWLGDPGPTRNLRVPLAALSAGSHSLRLIVPGDNDVSLGNVVLV